MSESVKSQAEVFRRTSVDSYKPALVYVWFDVKVDGQIIHDGDGMYNPTPEEEVELKALSELIAEAFNVKQETGRTPAQLVAERAELAKVLSSVSSELFQKIADRHSPEIAHNWPEIVKADTLLEKLSLELKKDGET